MVTDSVHRRRAEEDEQRRAVEPAEAAPPAEALLRLQATAGNQAVARLMAARGTAAARRLQRLVGFEAELSVPSMPEPPSAVTDAFPKDGRKGQIGRPPTGAIQGFLEGGLPYGTSAPLGTAGTHFRLAADHNPLKARHAAIRDALENESFKIPPRKRTMSNLEFVTPPVDELAPGSTRQLMDQFNAITTYAQALVSSASQDRMSAIPPPAAGAHTGIPVYDLHRWLGYDYGVIREPVQAFKKAVKDRFYLQATVGIMPSALPTLFASRAPAQDPATVHEAAARIVHAVMTGLERYFHFKNHPWIKDLKNDHPTDYDAFVGLLYLTYSYIVGNAINGTNLLDGKSVKNAVPFLSKLKEFPHVKSAAMPTHLRGSAVPDDLKGHVTDFFLGKQYHEVEWWKRNWQLDDSARARGPVIADAYIIDTVLSGNVTAVIGPGRPLPRADVLPKPVRTAAEGQKGLPLEYRKVGDRPAAAGLAAALMKVVQEVRDLNTRHMAPDEKRDLLAQANA